MSCPICQKRKPKRFCPAKGESICAICCGTEREASIDCPSDCPHLLAARRYETEHRKPLRKEEIPYPDVDLSLRFIQEQREALSGLSYSILKFSKENNSIGDADTLAALAALAETSRTLNTGIYYERPPDVPRQRALYGEMARFLEEFKKQQAQQTGFSQLKGSEIFRLLVFLLRVGRRETNGRPRSRAFLDFLRAQFPRSAEIQAEAPRIIMP